MKASSIRDGGIKKSDLNSRRIVIVLYCYFWSFLAFKDKNDQRETIKLLRAANFNITDYFFPMRFEFSAGPK